MNCLKCRGSCSCWDAIEAALKDVDENTPTVVIDSISGLCDCGTRDGITHYRTCAVFDLDTVLENCQGFKPGQLVSLKLTHHTK